MSHQENMQEQEIGKEKKKLIETEVMAKTKNEGSEKEKRSGKEAEKNLPEAAISKVYCAVCCLSLSSVSCCNVSL